MNETHPTPNPGGRARTRAIRDRMTSTGENWTTAARHHDNAAGQTAEKLPSRVVDHDNQGWHQVGTVDSTDAPRYQTSFGREDGLVTLDWTELAATRAPLREVLPITAADSARLRELFAAAGRRTVTTLAAALHQTLTHIVTQRLKDTGATDPTEAYSFAERTLRAGRPGSWEASALMDITWYGNDLNNERENKSPAAEEPLWLPSKRVDQAVRDQLSQIITSWITDPARYTEVAETLAVQVSQYGDATAGADGWRTVADQWLQPGALGVDDFRSCYRLLYSVSDHFNYELL